MNKKKLVSEYKDLSNLLKSGKFTLAYHDNGRCTIHKGLFPDYEETTEETQIAEFDCEDDGYAPYIVILLASALGGNVDSI